MKMDKIKILAVLLAISLGGNVFFFLASVDNTPAGGIIGYLMYPYPGTLPPLDSTTGNLTVDDNTPASGIIDYLMYPYAQALPPQDNSTDNLTIDETATLNGNFTANDDPPLDENQMLLELLIQMEEEGTLDKSILMMFLGIDNEMMSIGTENVTPEPEVTPDPDAWKVYTTTKWRFSLPYPPSWVVKEGTSSNPAVTFSAPAETECSAETTECYQYVAALAIVIDQNPSTVVLEDYFNQRVAALQKNQGITATSKSAPTTVSENNAYWIEYYTRDTRGNPLKWFMQYFTIIDKKAYVLTYSGPYSTAENVYTYYKPDAQKMIDEFIVDRVYKIA